MRENKFRVWDKELNMYRHDEIHKFLLKHTGEIYDTMNDEYTSKRFIVEFFTGLKDKNGNDIYENDIVRGRLAWDKEIKNHKVYFDEDVYGYMPFRDVYETCEGDDNLQSYMCEVVGNVWEHPELLKEQER